VRLKVIVASIVIEKGAESSEISEGLSLLVERNLKKLVEEIRVRGIEARVERVYLLER